MSNSIFEITEGQLKIANPKSDKFTLADAGMDTSYKVEGGNLRLKVDFGALDTHSFFRMPSIQFNYENNIHESDWVVEFNGEYILEKTDHSGSSTVILLNRSKMDCLKQRHENILIIHAEFSEEVSIKNDSTLHLLEK